MAVDVLSMLEGVRDTGGGNHVARCPAHDDRSPSLSIKLCDDGRVLLHCFAGCDIEEICASLGLQMADLMPDRRLEHGTRQVRRRMPARDALAAIDHEALVVTVIANDMISSRRIDEATFGRLAQAVARIGKARDACAPARHRK